jgi:hypothetical protein
LASKPAFNNIPARRTQLEHAPRQWFSAAMFRKNRPRMSRRIAEALSGSTFCVENNKQWLKTR